MIKLSRYLYILDEVTLTFITCLLNKRNIKECLFWISEYYYSGYKNETWYLLGKIYLDFYAVHNPCFENIIINKYKLWKNSDKFINIAYIVKSLLIKKHNVDVFMIRQYMYCNDTKYILYRGRRPNWLLKYNKKFANLLLSINKNNYNNIGHYIKTIEDTELDNMYINIINYYKETYKININYNEQELITNLNEKCGLFPYIDINKYKRHLIVCLIFSLRLDDDKINKKQIILKDNIKLLDYVKEIKEIDNPSKDGYNTLREKLLYPIDNNIGCFNLERFNVSDIKNEILMNWDSYLYNVPLWKERIDKLNGKMVNNKLIFEDEDMQQEFYNKYGYYPDEISDIYYNRIIGNIKKINCNKKDSIIIFPDNYSLCY